MLPEKELWQLFRAAYEQYQSEIIRGEKSYLRYVNDFVNYHLPVFVTKESDVRLHVMRVIGMKELLEERRDLIDAFFTKGQFEEKDYLMMYYLFNTGKNLSIESDCLARFSEQQISLIANFANHVGLFKAEVKDDDIKNLFECKSFVPLQASNNRHVALFFATLRYYGLLPFAWQMIIENNKLISSSSNNQPIRASQLRCGLSQAKKSILAKPCTQDGEEPDFESTCKDFVKNLIDRL